MRLKYVVFLLFVVLTACNISEKEADDLYKLALENKRDPYKALQYFERASSHEKYRNYGVAIQMFDTGCYLWQRKEMLDVNQVYIEETILKSIEIFFEIAQNESAPDQDRFRSGRNLFLMFQESNSNYHIIAKDLLEKNDPSLMKEIKEFLDAELAKNAKELEMENQN